MIAAWGPGGRPGQLDARHRARRGACGGGRRVGLIDADTHAPSLALALGLADEDPPSRPHAGGRVGGLDAGASR